jgi:hypothetical protein
VEFYAVADKEELSIDDTLTLTVTVGTGNEEPDDLRLPEAPDFDVISRTQSSQMSFAMGQSGPPSFRKVRLFTLILSPRKLGNLTVRPGRLVMGGKAHETGAIKVRVVSADKAPPKQAPPPPQAQQPQNPFGLPPGALGGLGGILGGGDEEDPFAGLLGGGAREATDSDLYLRVITDKKQVYLGEQVTLSVYLFSRMDISGVDGFKMPKLDGFWAEDLESPTQITGEVKMIDGVHYRVFLLKKRALFPIKSGKTTIDPTEVDVSTGFALVLAGRKVHRASPSMTLDVLPLPANAPQGFESPNVGQWRLSAEVSPTVTQLGQTVSLKVTLEGVGNLKNVALPKLPAMKGFKAFDPTHTDKVSLSRGRYGGKRTAEYLLMPEQTGSFEVPSLTFPYFDPGTKRYEVASTAPLTVRVETGGAAPATGAATSGQVSAPDRAVNVIGTSGVRPLRYKGALGRPAKPVYLAPYFVPTAASPFAAFLALAAFGFLRGALSESDSSARTRKAGSRARKRLRRAESLLKASEVEGFYAEVSRALCDYLSDKLRTPVAGLTRLDLAARLSQSGLTSDAVQRIGAVLDTCDAGRFAPGATESSTMSRVHGEAIEAMEAVEAAKLTAPPPEARA